MARYIDADKIISHLNDEIESCVGHDVDYQPVTYGTYLGLKYAKSLVETAETADVQEVRHGHWIEDKETGCLICSECGRFTDEIIGDMIEQDGKIIHRSMNPFYCSKCGAKMDGKEESEDEA